MFCKAHLVMKFWIIFCLLAFLGFAFCGEVYRQDKLHNVPMDVNEDDHLNFQKDSSNR